ncbi:C40 family peptidase [Paenibacillus alkalitolerans]|uniref:C40 family peptidase n=1 Tax=Paenibacillus alkalitolerans TaxID=2799335 RepID=UPI0018F48138|nr:SH3 domain-containing C40 family peptidase [Paenibacillus alkalitolerans]
MRKSIILLASVLAIVFFASSVSAAVQYETVVTWGVNFRDQPTISGYKYRMIPKGERIHVIEKVNSGWLKIQVQDGTIGYISAKSKYTSSLSTRDKLVSTAKSYIGDFKYRWGAEPWTTNYQYTDCSAYIELVFRNHGMDLSRSSRTQSKEGVYVSRSNLSKGDLVFFDTNSDGTINHVGMYIGDNQFIHASPSFNGVGISSLSGFWSRTYVTARDVLR